MIVVYILLFFHFFVFPFHFLFFSAPSNSVAKRLPFANKLRPQLADAPKWPRAKCELPANKLSFGCLSGGAVNAQSHFRRRLCGVCGRRVAAAAAADDDDAIRKA